MSTREPTEVIPKDNSSKKGGRWLRRLVLGFGFCIAGLVVGLVVVEAAFWLRDDGAFPHVNFYLADEELGTRLIPGAEMRLKFRDNPTTSIRVNDKGYRGAEWGSPADNEILVVGDSQVFGLGVEEDETFAAVLAAKSGRPVLNGGVPTYGPQEYEAVVREVFKTRQPKTVVVVYNMANDWFEHAHPNKERHAVWDGWAVRKELGPSEVSAFPGRSLLYRHSHAFYALRRLWHGYTEGESMEHATPLTDVASEDVLPSEGNWHDVVRAGRMATTARTDLAREAEQELLAYREALKDAKDSLSSADRALDHAFLRIDRPYLQGNEVDYAMAADIEVAARSGDPGDIIQEEYEESSRSVALTAWLIRQAVRNRDRVLQNARGSARRTAAELLAAKREQEAQLEALRAGFSPAVEATSALAPSVDSLRAVVEEHGAELVVVALPLDVQVSAEEWDKYDGTKVDMSGTETLLDELVAVARARGLRALNALEALAAAEPGAFLDADIHMTPKGHRALGEALATVVATPTPPAAPEPGLPEGRTRIPEPSRWLRVAEATVSGSSRAKCTTVQVDEWLRVSCIKRSRGSQPTGVTIRTDALGETLSVTSEEAATLVTPVIKGAHVQADFHWSTAAKRSRFVGRMVPSPRRLSLALRARVSSQNVARTHKRTGCASATGRCSTIDAAP